VSGRPRFRLHRVAGVLHVSEAGLRALAVHCETVSAALVSAEPMPSVGLPVQATTSAVGTAYAGVNKAVAVLAGRAQTSAIKAAVAGTEFAVTDAAGAQLITAIGASIKQV
jgi:hypothetical protein